MSAAGLVFGVGLALGRQVRRSGAGPGLRPLAPRTRTIDPSLPQGPRHVCCSAKHSSADLKVLWARGLKQCRGRRATLQVLSHVRDWHAAADAALPLLRLLPPFCLVDGVLQVRWRAWLPLTSARVTMHSRTSKAPARGPGDTRIHPCMVAAAADEPVGLGRGYGRRGWRECNQARCAPPP